MLLPFLKKFESSRFDPERIYVNYGKENYNLPIETKCSEEMILKNSLDLILILGSLEHCYDPNKTLKICSEAKNDSLIVLEGRGYPRSTAKYYFTNHHRYFS